MIISFSLQIAKLVFMVTESQIELKKKKKKQSQKVDSYKIKQNGRHVIHKNHRLWNAEQVISVTGSKWSEFHEKEQKERFQLSNEDVCKDWPQG